ncbi:MAG TPA: DUF1501 domain-containing protein [Opitutaceae bacterium]|nr:DUF1501 domain-containing protein [Opitutaceae bacterium]
MNPKNPAPDLTRRKFVGACCAAVGATGMLSALAQLRLIGAVASPTNGPVLPTVSAALQSDFKALVCLFLAGGNDANNMVVPADDATYAAYAAGRGVLALPQAALLGITPRTSDGHAWGLHPALGTNPDGTANGGIKSLFDQGKAAILANVGTLAYPLTQAQYTSRPDLRPFQLFSHNDQQVEWQSSIADKPFTTGWGGRLADLTNAFNSNNRISMAITLNGQNSFQVGKTVSQYAVGTNGAIALTGSSTNIATTNGIRTAALNDALAAQNANLFETAFGGMTSSALSNSALLASAIGTSSPFASYFTGLTSNLSQQLHMIARLVNVQSQLGLKRQVFFARIGGWDLHDSQVNLGNTTNGAHASLFRDVSQSVTAFYNALTSVGAQNQVTTFTASDFGRTYNTNGDGSDHGWGSHHLVIGGAVNGGDIYGRMPTFAINGPDDTGRGRWIPTTSVDEYSATLAKWFGVSATDMPVVLPNLNRFANPDLGFMM